MEASGRVTSWQCCRPVVLEDVSRPGRGGARGLIKAVAVSTERVKW